MPTAPSLYRPSARPRSRRVGPVVAIVAAIVAAIAATLALFAITSSMLAGPERVDMVIENHVLSVRVSGADGGSGHTLGPISSGSTREFSGVLDQGDTWLFKVSYGGVQAGELVVERSELMAAPVAVAPAVATAVLMDLREERRLQPMLVARLAGDLAGSPYANRADRPPCARRLAETPASEAVDRRATRILDHQSGEGSTVDCSGAPRGGRWDVGVCRGRAPAELGRAPCAIRRRRMDHVVGNGVSRGRFCTWS